METWWDIWQEKTQMICWLKMKRGSGTSTLLTCQYWKHSRKTSQQNTETTALKCLNSSYWNQLPLKPVFVCSVEEPSLLEVSFSPDSTSYPTAEDTMFHYIINQLTLVGHLFVYIHDMIEKQGPIPETMVIYATQLSCFRADYV